MYLGTVRAALAQLTVFKPNHLHLPFMKRPGYFLVCRVVTLSLAIVICCIQGVYSHSGGTDHQGGHFNRRTGEYHFHHGMSAHQHSADQCPYDRTDIALHFKSKDQTDNEVGLQEKWSRSVVSLIAGVITGWVGWQRFFGRMQSADK